MVENECVDNKDVILSEFSKFEADTLISEFEIQNTSFS